MITKAIHVYFQKWHRKRKLNFYFLFYVYIFMKFIWFVLGYYAYRNKCYGSYLLRYLYEVVEKHYKNGGLIENQINLLDVLQEVAAIMAKRTYLGEKYTVVPCVVYKLDRDIIFTQGKKMISSKFLLKILEIYETR